MKKIATLLLLSFTCILVSCGNDDEDDKIYEQLTTLDNTAWETDEKGSDNKPIGTIDFGGNNLYEWWVYEYVDGERTTKSFKMTVFTYEYPTINLGKDMDGKEIIVTMDKTNNKFTLEGMVYRLKN